MYKKPKSQEITLLLRKQFCWIIPPNIQSLGDHSNKKNPQCLYDMGFWERGKLQNTQQWVEKELLVLHVTGRKEGSLRMAETEQ